MKLNKEKIISFLLLFFSAIVFAAATFLLVDNRYISEWLGGKESNTKVVAHITKLENDVRRKSANRFVWLPTTESADIKNYDSIFTGDHSTTEVEFLDKTSIALNPKTLISIKYEENQILLKKGSIKINLPKGGYKKLIVNNKPYQVTAQESSVVEVIANEINQEPELKVVSGGATLQKLDTPKTVQAINDEKINEVTPENITNQETIEESTSAKSYNPIKREEFSEVKLIDPAVLLPEIPNAERKLSSALAEEEPEAPPKIYGLDLDLGIYAGLSSMQNSVDSSSANYIYPRSMLVGAAFFEFGWQLNRITPFIYGEYRIVGQLTPAVNVGNQNMAGSGYLLGAGLKYDWDNSFLSAGYEFLGSYKLNKQTTLNESVIYSNPSGFFLTLGYKINRKLRLTYTFNMLSYGTWNLSDTEQYKLNQTTHGLGFQYEVF